MSDKILNFKADDGYEIIVNFSNVLYVDRNMGDGYKIIFLDGTRMELTWKEYDRFTKALQQVSE